MTDMQSISYMNTRMATILQAEKDGRLVVLPLKVGTTVYRTNTEGWSWLPDISECVITCLTITQNKKGQWTKKYRAHRIKNGKTIDSWVNVAFEDIGKTIFLTREEAEAMLKEDRRDA